ncbi:MAG TPA: TlpA disulfide reductase family protein [Polyangiaceae bacterium]
MPSGVPPAKIKPTSNPRQAYVTVALVLVTSLLFGLLVLPRISARPGRVGATAPEFSLPIVAGGNTGDRVSLQAQRGKVVLLDFWATWCGPCAEQAQILERFVATKRDGVAVFGVNEGESFDTLQPYFRQHHATYTMLSDADERLGEQFGVRGLPTLAVIDASGRIASLASGVVSYERLERLVAEATTARSASR